MPTVTTAASATMLDGFESFMESGAGIAALALYQGVIPLCSFSLAAAPFGAATARSLVAAGAPISNTGTAQPGTPNRWVLINQNAAEAMVGTLSGIGGGGDIETPSLTVTGSATQKLNSFVVRMAPSGALTVEASLTLV